MKTVPEGGWGHECVLSRNGPSQVQRAEGRRAPHPTSLLGLPFWSLLVSPFTLSPLLGGDRDDAF